MKSIGIYIHIPFCKRKCNYCDFCSYTDNKKSELFAYTDELCRRIKLFADSKEARQNVDTIYFGGGTPSLLPKECIQKIITVLNDCFCIHKDAEITLECNPATVDFNGLRALREMGINRLSIGLQSANDNELKLLGRLHSYSDFEVCFEDARRAGFDNISVDLMYGIPEQTKESFEQTLRRVALHSPEHISAYCLKIEEGTAFAKNRDKLCFPDDDAEYEMYCMCNTVLFENGYSRYEISNFAKSGRCSRHNLRYWRLEDYIGFGVAAHSFVDGERFGNSRDIKAFLAGEDITEEKYKISSEERMREYIMLSLRLAEGIDICEYEERFGRDFKTDFKNIEKYIEGGFMQMSGTHIFFTTKGFFVSNTILCDLLSFG